jgi:hypothetical protein
MVLQRVLEKKHYRPRIVDDKLAGDIYTHFIGLLDKDGLYFTATQLKELSSYSFI